MERITQKDLEQAVRVINSRLGFQLEPYGKDENGKFKPHPNVYHLDYAYGAVALEQMMPEGSGVRSVLGRGTKRELYGKLLGFIAGMEAEVTAAGGRHDTA